MKLNTLVHAGMVWYVATMSTKPRVLNISYTQAGELSDKAGVLIYDAPSPYFTVPTKHLPPYVFERIAMMQLCKGIYPRDIHARLLTDMGVWIGSRQLLLGLTRFEYKELKTIAKATKDDPGSKGKEAGKGNIGPAQRLLFHACNWWLRCIGRT